MSVHVLERSPERKNQRTNLLRGTIAVEAGDVDAYMPLLEQHVDELLYYSLVRDPRAGVWESQLTGTLRREDSSVRYVYKNTHRATVTYKDEWDASVGMLLWKELLIQGARCTWGVPTDHSHLDSFREAPRQPLALNTSQPGTVCDTPQRQRASLIRCARLVALRQACSRVILSGSGFLLIMTASVRSRIARRMLMQSYVPVESIGG
jgi:hypothetical protein